MSSSPVVPESTLVYQSIRFDVRSCFVKDKNNNQVKKEFVSHPGAVVILPLLNDEEIILIRNERFAVGETLWELPAGTLEKDEPPNITAYRELIEETGYEANKILHLISFYTSPGICNEIMHLFLASDLQYEGQNLEDTEKIEVDILKWEKALQMIKEGKIHDGKTITSLLYYQTFSRSQ